MDISRLLQPLSSFPTLDVVQYYIVTKFLATPTFDNAVTCCNILDQEIQCLHHYSDEQLNCIRYMYRDWCFQFMSESLSAKQRKELFSIKDSDEKPGYLLSSIDFVKKNPKENQKIIQFALSLLIHLPNRCHDVDHKIQAIEQLISSVNIQSLQQNLYYRPKSYWVRTLCVSASLLVIIWTIPKLKYPLL